MFYSIHDNPIHFCIFNSTDKDGFNIYLKYYIQRSIVHETLDHSVYFEPNYASALDNDSCKTKLKKTRRISPITIHHFHATPGYAPGCKLCPFPPNRRTRKHGIEVLLVTSPGLICHSDNIDNMCVGALDRLRLLSWNRYWLRVDATRGGIDKPLAELAVSPYDNENTRRNTFLFLDN